MNIKGYVINILGMNVAVEQKPSYPVVKFLTKEEYDKKVQSLDSKWVRRETLTALDDSKIIVYYIFKASR
jgi:hypothetical protein